MMPPLQLAWRIPRVFYSEAIPVAATQLWEYNYDKSKF
jgi:hypothetical protein